MGRHAYLIMAHKNFIQLQTLINLLDDERNDLYVHIDKKVKQFPHLTSNKSSLHIFHEISVFWGTFSQVECELFLLEKASKQEHEYYHLLSGLDLPLASQDEIHVFFDKNRGKEFVDFKEEYVNTKQFERKKRFYYFFVQNSNSTIKNKIISYINKMMLIPQYVIHINRESKWGGYRTYYGANWFSITHACAKYVVNQKEWIEKRFNHSSGSDELFLQTVIGNSRFLRAVYGGLKNSDNLRFVDWTRSVNNGRNPHVFTKEDYELLQKERQSGKFFARKFDENIDSKIIEEIAKQIKQG